MHSEFCPEVTDRSGSINHSDKEPTAIGGNRSKNPFKTNLEVPGENESASSSEDLFQVVTEFANFDSYSQPSEDAEINASNNNSSRSKAFDTSPRPTSKSQFPQVTNVPAQYPPKLVMDCSGEYDPLWIPSAIFERSKSLTSQEWSVVSNESLFSIRIGSNSFSRDQFMSGELTKTDELMMLNPSPTIPELVPDREVDEFENSDATSGAVKNGKNSPKETTIEKNQEKAPANVLQNPSDMSSHSKECSCLLAFPIKKKKKKMKKRCSACHSSSILTDGVNSVTVKPDVADKQKKKPLAPEATPESSSRCCWFCCFSCRPCPCSFYCFRCFGCRSCGCCCWCQ